MITISSKTPMVLFFLACLLGGSFNPVQAQVVGGAGKDTLPMVVNDSLLPGVMLKVASYTATIDHTDFLLRRKFNIAPISAILPGMEKRVKGFKRRLDRKGSQMNLRSLNSAVIMLAETNNDLAGYQRVLDNYSKELMEGNIRVKEILQDPVLKAVVVDSTLNEQLQEIRSKGISLDSFQKITITRVNLLRNRVSVNLMEATDVISDMNYLSLVFKMGMWKQEEMPLLSAKATDYDKGIGEITTLGLMRGVKIIGIYVNEKWRVLTLALVLFICILCWLNINKRKVNALPDFMVILQPVHFFRRSLFVACSMALFTYLPFFYANPPMSFLHACDLMRLVCCSFLLFPYLASQSKAAWWLICGLWVWYALDNLLLEAALAERWGLLIAGILLAALCLRLLTSKKAHFTNLSDSPATTPMLIFTAMLAIFSVLFNLTGRLSLAKIAGVSAIQGLVLGISLKVFCTMVLEAIYLQSEAYQKSRFSDFINFTVLRQKFLRVLWMLAGLVWTISLIRNFTLYDTVLQFLDQFFSATRSIGNMVFTFQSVAIFICIIWLSSVISGVINFFFGNDQLKAAGKRSKLGSMMLLIRLTIWALGFGIAVAAAGIPLDKLSIMIGALGIGIGFGLQNIVNNLVSGVIIAFERPIQVGDLIEVGGKMGVVKEIGVRSSKINNNEGADIIVPNGDLLSQHLINWTMQDMNKQVHFLLAVPYDADLTYIRSRIVELLIANQDIMPIPAPLVMVQQFGDWSVDLKVLFWVDDLSNAGSIRSKAMLNVFDTLVAEGVQLPVHKGPPVGAEVLI